MPLHVLIVSRGTQAISRENVHAWSRLAIVNVTGTRATASIKRVCTRAHTPVSTTWREERGPRAYCICGDTCSRDALLRSALLLPVIVHARSIRVRVYSRQGWVNARREREILFLEKGEKRCHV